MEEYDVTNDLSGNEVTNPYQLSQEIAASSISSNVSSISATSATVKIYFDVALSAPDKTTLDGIMTSHVSDLKPNTNRRITIIPRIEKVKHSSYRKVASFSLPETTYANASIVSRMDAAAGSYTVRLIDIHGQTLITSTLSNVTEQESYLGELTNLSTETTVLYLHAKRNAGNSSDKIYIENLIINYV